MSLCQGKVHTQQKISYFKWICENVKIKDIKAISDIQNLIEFMRIPILQDVYVKLSQIF